MAEQCGIYWRIVNSQHVLIVFAETPGANYALSQFFHQDDDQDDDHHDDHCDHCDNHDHRDNHDVIIIMTMRLIRKMIKALTLMRTSAKTILPPKMIIDH